MQLLKNRLGGNKNESWAVHNAETVTGQIYILQFYTELIF